MPMESVVDTMLHELCHNVYGPHDAAFHALWDQLRDEQQGLLMKGYTGEGFLSEGRRLGGASMPPREARRLAREAAEKRQRRPTGTGLGRRLGGAAPRPGEDIRRVIVDAIERRNETLKGCAMERMNEQQIRHLADTATRNGFRTRAEEDKANEIAIAQAMWELVQEDEQAKYGGGYIPPSAANPAGNGGGSVVAASDGPSTSTGNGQSVSAATPEPADDIWVCGTCTLHNPSTFLCCDACGAEWLQGGSHKEVQSTRSKPSGTSKPETIDLTESPPRKRQEKRRRIQDASQPAAPAVPSSTPDVAM